METNKQYKKFLEFLLEQIALFPQFDFGVGDSPETSSRGFYRNIQTYTGFFILAGMFDDEKEYLKFREDLQTDVNIWQAICKSYQDIVSSKSKDKYQKLKTIVEQYREKLAAPEAQNNRQAPQEIPAEAKQSEAQAVASSATTAAAPANVPSDSDEEMSQELQAELGLIPPSEEDAEAEAALAAQQEKDARKIS